MANECLVTKLKGTVQNANLRKLGELVLFVDSTGFPAELNASQRRLGLKTISGGSVQVSVTGSGLFGLSSSDITRDATSPYTLTNGSSNFYFSNGIYEIHLSNKYDIEELQIYGAGSEVDSSKSIISIVLNEDFSYMPQLKFLRPAFTDSIGDVKYISGLTNLEYFVAVGSRLEGDASSLYKLVNLYDFSLSGTNIPVSRLEDFVSGQYDNGRQTVETDELSSFGVFSFMSLHGQRPSVSGTFKITWDDKTHIAVWKDQDVWFIGYTGSEEQFAGKTKHKLDQ